MAWNWKVSMIRISYPLPSSCQRPTFNEFSHTLAFSKSLPDIDGIEELHTFRSPCLVSTALDCEGLSPVSTLV